jgi:hypothetical protein
MHAAWKLPSEEVVLLLPVFDVDTPLLQEVQGVQYCSHKKAGAYAPSTKVSQPCGIA